MRYDENDFSLAALDATLDESFRKLAEETNKTEVLKGGPESWKSRIIELSQAKLCESYLAERGLDVEFARANGVELDAIPQSKRIIERLGKKCAALCKVAREILWFALQNERGESTEYIARPLPTPPECPKYIIPADSTAPPFITKLAYQSAKDVKIPLIITEGPLKALVLAQAGFASVGLGGFWCAHASSSDDRLRLRSELVELGLKGRQVYICFAADSTMPELRQAAIRLYFLLAGAGAEPYQLTSWDESHGKGIDDFLVAELRAGRNQTAQAVVQNLMTNAQPFQKTFSETKLDLEAVESELKNVELGSLYREQLCSQISRCLGVRVDSLRHVGRQSGAEDRELLFPQVDPWPEPVNGHSLVQDMMDIIRRHLVLNDYAVFTVVCWCLLSWFWDSEKIDTLPFLTLASPDKRCGKTRLQTVVEWFVPRPLSVSNVSPAVIYRTTEKYHPTLLLDEADTYVLENEELRGLLNAGHTRAKAFALRCHPITLEPELFSVWCPKSLALIGDLPATLVDRSILVRMERKKRSEKVKTLRTTEPEERQQICSKICRWHQDNEVNMDILDAPTTEEISDRDADNWLPLLQVARLLGPTWFDFCLQTVRKLNPTAAEEENRKDPKLALLAGLQRIYQEAKVQAQEILLPIEKDNDFLIGTTDLLTQLNEDKEAPWADWRKGQGMSAEKLAKLLGPFKIKSVQKKGRPRGYLLGQLQPIFERYLPAASPDTEEGNLSDERCS